MNEIEAKSLDTLPTAFTFTAPPFAGLHPAAITLRLSVISGNDEPVLKLCRVGEELQREELASEFKAVLGQKIWGFRAADYRHFADGR